MNQLQATPQGNSENINNVPNDMNDLNSISVKRPSFPPTIDVNTLVTNLLKHKTKNPKMPNEFFIYRAALVKELKANNYKIRMTKLSTLAADSWSVEQPSVKSAYRKLARETERLYLNARSLQMSNSTNLPKKDSNNNLPPKREPEINAGIGENVTMSSFPKIVTRPTLEYPQYPSQTCLTGNDFMLMDNSTFGMRPGYNYNTLYLIPPQEKTYSYIDNLSISTYSSENSSPVSAYWSLPSSPLMSSPSSLSSTNINELNDNLREESNHFFAPLNPSELGYNMNTLSINDLSQNYPQFFEGDQQ